MSRVVRVCRAGRVGLVGAAGAGTGAVVLVSPSPTAAAVGGGAVLALVGGCLRSSRRLLTLAATLLFGCVLTAAVLGVPTPLVLVATVLAVLAYDLAENALALRRQVPDAATTRVELVHATATTTLAGGVAGVAYALSSLAPSGLPGVAFLGLLAGAVVLVLGLRA
ncbi:DUF7519 family protein [Halomarina rubra]|uniref:Uncharacterized protein n=1 Tax=Halomarina rubra TaxID=2071873 RepID=A0ABD6AQJ7_9EURY|nr:hypothetical protein [Halomarina rubra]